ncbi:MAG: T9SS type A sorting domain-containing protein [Rhodothermales bacterium]|nr:T9SS type A sorting domain-containing protein [Rhodothermales bacterium]
MMKHIVTIVAVLFIVNTASGQITLDESTLEALVGKRLVSVDYEPSDTTGAYAISQQTGENETWVITSFGWTVTDTVNIDFLSSAAGTPGENDPDFASANLIQVASLVGDTSNFENASYSFFDESGLMQQGSVFIGDADDDGDLDTLKSLYTPAELDIPFPFTYQTVVMDSVTHEQFASDTLFSSEQVAKEGFVDGYGTLVTPDGSFDVLRYKYEERVYGDGFVFVETTVEWWGPTGPIFSVDIIDFGFGTFIDLYYSTQTVVEITAVDPDDFSLPTTFALQQNYPNPFNPSTTIPFDLQESAYVNLAVYDLLGRRVELLIDGQLPVGTHEVSWSAENVPGGLYVARLEVNGQRQSRTMTLLK